MTNLLFQDAPLRVGISADARGHSPAKLLQAGKQTPAERRRSGRTHRMIMSLPADGAVVIVHSAAMIGAFRDLIRELGGAEVAGLIRIVAAASIADELRVTANLSLPVVRDHFVEEQREHARAVMQAWRP